MRYSMQRPAAVKFTGIQLSQYDQDQISNAGVKKVTTPEWTRLHFEIPTSREAVAGVYDWLKNNCKGQYTIYKFNNVKTYNEYKVVIRFEHAQDAIIFKLSDGHRNWEQKE